MSSQSLRKQMFSQVRKLVIKIGTGVLAADDGSLRLDCIDRICRQVHELGKQNVQVIIVTSGAIGAGMGALGLRRRPTVLPVLQATAAVGQNRLMLAYDQALNKYGHHAGQVLLTREDLEDRRRFVNVGNTIRELLRLGAVPVVNENDTVSVDEIKFGGNDLLAAQVLHVLRADALIYLSTVDGLNGSDGNVIDVVEKITDETFRLDTGKKTALGIGGMQSKLQSIRQISEAGEPVVIANGTTEDVVVRIMAGEPIGTLFCPAKNRLRTRKRWLRFSAKPRGTITVDEGAVRALVEKNKSLLASGICKVAGNFSQGDIVAVAGPVGGVVARGLTHYSSEEVEIIKGAKTGEIKALLGYKYYDEVIHRDNLVVLE